MHPLLDKLRRGETIVLDGGTGSELERRGAPMDEGAWCALATVTHGELLRAVHEDYIRAGADIVVANTFAGSRLMLGPAGHGDRVEPINRRAVAIALEARERAAEGRPVAVAGSISHMMPIPRGVDCRDPARLPSADEASAAFGEMAGLLEGAGVDLILMEMMSDPAYAVLAVGAAVETGLPVWVGMSCRTREDGALVSWSRDDLPLRSAAREIMAAGGAVAGVMHSDIDDITAGLEALRGVWQGPLMAYPESGHFEMPHWRFEASLTPEAFAQQCLEWVAAGVQVVGGCCGIGPEHIRALAERLARGEADPLR